MRRASCAVQRNALLRTAAEGRRVTCALVLPGARRGCFQRQRLFQPSPVLATAREGPVMLAANQAIGCMFRLTGGDQQGQDLCFATRAIDFVPSRRQRACSFSRPLVAFNPAYAFLGTFALTWPPSGKQLMQIK